MIFRASILEGIAAGRIDRALRRRPSPPARAGGTQLTAIGVVAFDSVEAIAEDELTDAEARSAGFASRTAALSALGRFEGPVWCVRLRLAGPDPRLALRETIRLDAADVDQLRERLRRLDRSSPRGPWTQAMLRIINDQPQRRAAELAAAWGWDTVRFKMAVRHLKALGLTESLAIGYRLSPRGRALLGHLGS